MKREASEPPFFACSFDTVLCRHLRLCPDLEPFTGGDEGRGDACADSASDVYLLGILRFDLTSSDM